MNARELSTRSKYDHHGTHLPGLVCHHGFEVTPSSLLLVRVAAQKAPTIVLPMPGVLGQWEVASKPSEN